MDKLLVIRGPTATGKTKLATRLSKKFNGVIISADSRQVYKGLDIGTGKERPEGVEIFGYDLVEPDEEFSVSQFVNFADEAIKRAKKAEKLPILVGGTGLYIKAVVDGIETVAIPPNSKLRKELAKLNTDKLFERLKESDPIKALSLNESDKKNPRRLIRAIEIYQSHDLLPTHRLTGNRYDAMMVGLKLDKDLLEKRIRQRVLTRVDEGIEDEINNLLKDGVSWSDRSMTSLGYRQWRDYFEGKKTKDEVIEHWIREEINYAKRQITWFKKDKRINWFDINRPNWRQNVENLVKKWYSKTK